MCYRPGSPTCTWHTEMAKLIAHRYSTRSISRLISNVRDTGEGITGHSEVLQSQKQVQDCKDALKMWRKKLAAVSTEYEEVQQQLKGLYIRKTHVYQDQKRELLVLQAINNEEESLLFSEQKVASCVEKCKQNERDSFEALSDAIQESHEKERAQSERMKYYTRIGSLLGAFFGFLGSNFFIRRQITQHNLEQSKRLLQIEETLKQVENKAHDLSLVKTVETIQQHLNSIDQSVGSMSEKVDGFSTSTKLLESTQGHDHDRGKECSPVTLEQPKNSDIVALGSVMSYSFLLTLLALM